MRKDKVAGRALVVLAMALVGWFSPTNAEPSERCNEWFCVEPDGPVDCADQLEIQQICDQECSSWTYYYCEEGDIPCAEWEFYLYCHKPH